LARDFVGRNIPIETEASLIFSGVAFFYIEIYEAKTTVDSLWKRDFR
jgi:hypothetical protein